MTTLTPNPVATAFPYDGTALTCEGVRLDELAKQHGTPLYVYSAREFVRRYQAIEQAIDPIRDANGAAPQICYSVKANSNIHILRLLAEKGCGFDIVSLGELRRVMEAGAEASRVVFAGVGKQDHEIREAIEAGVGLFNVESEGELHRIAAVAAELGRPEGDVRVALRLNPDIDPETHAYITTGKKENKFGIDLATARRLIEAWPDARVALHGVHLHIGSQIRIPAKYAEAVGNVAEMLELAKANGHPISLINLGGGFGVDYASAAGDFDLSGYRERVEAAIAPFGKLRLLIEPGRYISAAAGVLVTRVIYTKPAGPHRFLVIDGAMNDLMRPSLYQAYHCAWPVVGHGAPPENGDKLDQQAKEAGEPLTNLVGPICETGDFLALGRQLPTGLDRDALVAVFHAGAYGFTMASNYNTRPRAAEVLILDDGRAKLIRRRETYDDLLAAEREV